MDGLLVSCSDPGDTDRPRRSLQRFRWLKIPHTRWALSPRPTASEELAPALGGAARSLGALPPFVCAVLSGGAGLLYQVLWNRELLLLFGSTSASVAAVVAAFMLGMSLGAWGIGRLGVQRRRWALALYAVLELGIAGYALLFSPLLFDLQRFYPGLWRAALSHPMLLNVLRLGLGMLMLAPPTLLMGATLPLLVEASEASRNLAAKSVGWLYGLNAAGGALGALTTGWLLLPTLGMRDTRSVGVAMSASAAILAMLTWAATRGQAPVASAETRGKPRESVSPPSARRVVILAMAGAGIASMGYEVLWTRMLVLVTGSSTYAFSLMLALYIAGVAVGSVWVASKVARLKAPGDLFAHLQIGAAFLVVSGLWLFARYPDWQLHLYQTWGTSFDASLLIDFVLATLIIVPPTFFLGAAFPVATEVLGGATHRGRAIATALAVVAIGNAVGALAAGTVLVPWLGLEGALAALAGLTALCGVSVAFTRFGSALGRRVGVVAAIGTVAFGSALLPRWDPLLLTSGVYERAPVYLALLGKSVRLNKLLDSYRLLDYQAGNQVVVSVFGFPTLRTQPHLALSIDGKVDASTGKDMSTEILSGHIGMLLRPAVHNVLVIGLASGVTVGSVEQWPSVRHIVVAEISPSVVHAEHWFAPYNHDAMRDPRVKLVIDDARHYLNVTRQRFQVMISEPSNPWESGPARLFTRQFFLLARDHLTRDGVFVQWLPLYGLSTALLKSEVRTYLSVFAHVAMLRVSAGDLLLIGSAKPLAPQPDQVLPATVRADLARVHSGRWRLLALFVAGTVELRHWVGTGPLNTDNNGMLEFGAPRYLLAPTLQANVASIEHIPWRVDLARWGARAPLPLARAYLHDHELARAAMLAKLAHPGPNRWTVQGDIAAKEGDWITATDFWRRAGTVSAELQLANLALSDEQMRRAAAALGHIAPAARTPYFHYLSMILALHHDELSAARDQAAQLSLGAMPQHGWQLLAAFLEDVINRRLAHGRMMDPPSRFDRMLDTLRRGLEREHGEPVLDHFLRRMRDLPSGLLDAREVQRLQKVLRTRLLAPMQLYYKGVSLFFMGRFGQARDVLEQYLRSLPTDSGPSYARVLIARARRLSHVSRPVPLQFWGG